MHLIVFDVTKINFEASRISEDEERQLATPGRLESVEHMLRNGRHKSAQPWRITRASGRAGANGHAAKWCLNLSCKNTKKTRALNTSLVHAYMQTRTHAHTYSSMPIHVCIHAHRRACFACVYRCMHIWEQKVGMCACTHVCMSTYMHGCMHARMRAYMHACMTPQIPCLTS